MDETMATALIPAGEDAAVGSAVVIPAELSTAAILAAIQSHATIEQDQPLSEHSLVRPTQKIILAAYSALVSLSSKYEAEVTVRETREVDVESQLNQADRLRSEAEGKAAAAVQESESQAAKERQSQATLAEREAELAALKANIESGAAASSEVKAILEKEQGEKRELLEVLDRERTESSRKDEELETAIARSRESRQEVNRLTTELQESKASEVAAKLKVQSLTQELELARNDATWAHSQLSQTNAEHTAFRTQKHAELVKVQSNLDEATQTLTGLQSKVEGLQTAYQDAARRLTEASSEKEDLNNRLASQEESFRREAETKDRLASLLERRADESKKRVEQVEGAWEQVLEECRDREEQLQDEVEKERQSRERLMQEKEELKLALDRLAESVGIDTERPQTNGNRAATPSTPMRPFATSLGLGGNSSVAMSPTAAMASSLQRSGKSFTEVYTALAKTEEQLRREKLESSRLASVLEGVMADLEERAPTLQAQRAETERLAAALEDLSADFARACEERDVAERESKRIRADSTAVQRENGLLNQQLSDLGRQVRALTREIIVRDDPSAASRLQDTHDGFPALDAAPADESDTQSVITTQLVTFDSLTSLVAQNGRLLRVARELGAKMEEEEAKWRERNDREETEAVREAMKIIERLESEVGSERTKTSAVRRERDMFRSMLANGSRGGLPSLSAPTGEGQESSSAHATLASQYTTLQNQFDAFREETAKDTGYLKEEARHARDEAGKTALTAAREKAGREASEERYRTLQQSFDLQQTETSELSKRLQSQQQQVARLETTSHSLSEQLLSSRQELERLRNESANLRAERDLAKSAETRLSEEIMAMVKEKAGLNELLRNIQTMQNDLDRSSSEAKRRLEAQVEKLEEQAKDHRERLQREETARREAELRRDVEVGSLQSRVERVTSELATSKEQLAVAKTSSEHLQRRIEDLQKQIDSQQEKLSVYERRSGGAAANGSAAAGASSLSVEQQLQIELADLRGELRSAQVEAEQSRSHVEQYKAIAQASEEALGQLQTTYEEYKNATEATLAQKEGEITQLRERLESVAAEITSLQNEASTARQALETARGEFASEKRSLEDALAELGSVEERAKVEHQDVRADIERQAQLARENHRKYESELLAHAEDIKALTQLKEELERTRTEARESQKSLETAQADVSSSRVSWEAQKEALTRERDAMEQRTKELSEQNNILHQNLETLAGQISQIRTNTGGQGSTAADPDASFSAAPTAELQDVVKYLRREKEIADLQVDLNKQEATRLRLSLEHANRALEEAKLQLADERERNASAGASAQQHSELLDKINQLSILRESNATLRDETEKAIKRSRTLETQLATARAEIEPLKEQVRTVQGELSAAQGQLRIVQEDNQRWQARAQSILAQYDRIDPEEVKRLEERASTAENSVKELQQQLEGSRAEVAASREQFAKLRTQAQERIKNLRAEVETITKDRDAAQAEVATLTAAQGGQSAEAEAATNDLRLELYNLEKEKATFDETIAASDAKVKSLEQTILDLQAKAESQFSTEEGTSDNTEAIATALAEAQKVWQEEKAALEKAKEATEAREQTHLQKAKEFLTARRTAERERDELRTQKEALEAKISSGAEADNKDEIERIVAERVAAQTNGQDGATSGSEAQLLAENESLKKQISELEAQLVTANARIAELEASIQQQQSGGSDEGHAEAMEKLRAEHQAALAQQSQQYQKRQTMAVDVAVKKAQAAAAASGTAPSAEAIEEQVQQRLKATEEQREQDKAQAIQSAVEAKEKELRELLSSGDGEGSSSNTDEAALKARYTAGFEAGRSEATLRNQLMLKQKEAKIANLQKEIAALKGTDASATTTPAAAASSSPTTATPPTGPGVPSRPGVAQVARGGGPAAARGARGGAAPSGPSVRPVPTATTTQAAGAAARGGRGGGVSVRGASARGGLAVRGGRGGAQAGGGATTVQKRKVSEDQGVGGGVKKAKGPE